jgi:hypothetical protein
VHPVHPFGAIHIQGSAQLEFEDIFILLLHGHRL